MPNTPCGSCTYVKTSHLLTISIDAAYTGSTPLTNLRLKLYNRTNDLLWTSALLGPTGGMIAGQTHAQTVGNNDSGAPPPSNPFSAKASWTSVTDDVQLL